MLNQHLFSKDSPGLPGVQSQPSPHLRSFPRLRGILARQALRRYVKRSPNALFIRLDDQLWILRLFVWIVHTGEILDLSFIDKLVEALYVSLAADFNRTFEIDFDKIPNFAACPLACLSIWSNGGRDAHDAIARQQATNKSDAFNIGIAVLAAKTQALAQMRTYYISIQYLDVAPLIFQAPLDDLSKGTFPGPRKTSKPDSKSCICH